VDEDKMDKFRPHLHDSVTENVLRYLGNSVAWVKAVYSLPRVTAFGTLQTQVSLITTSYPTKGHCSPEDCRQFLKDICLTPSTKVIEAITGDIRNGQPPLHAEAILMGLMKAAASGVASIDNQTTTLSGNSQLPKSLKVN
jgi:hypothetical protein